MRRKRCAGNKETAGERESRESGESRCLNSLVEIRAGHEVAARRIGAEELALALEEDCATGRTEPLGMGFPGIARRGSGNLVGLGRCLGLHGTGFAGSAGVEGEGTGVMAAGVSTSFRTSPAGVRSGSIGVVSGVGGAGSVACGAFARRPWPAAFEPQPVNARQAAASRRAVGSKSRLRLQSPVNLLSIALIRQILSSSLPRLCRSLAPGRADI